MSRHPPCADGQIDATRAAAPSGTPCVAPAVQSQRPPLRCPQSAPGRAVCSKVWLAVPETYATAMPPDSASHITPHTRASAALQTLPSCGDPAVGDTTKLVDR
jgi:hypothetical protein